MNFLIDCCEKQPIRKLGKRLRSYEKENRSLIPAGDKVPILKIRRCSVLFRRHFMWPTRARPIHPICQYFSSCSRVYLGNFHF